MRFKRHQRTRPSRRAFTFAEILVVISIIALMAAIVEPALLSARRAALRAPCQSNLRQVGSAFTMYLSDWDGRYPAAIDRFARTSSEVWSDYPPPIDRIPDLVAVLSVYTDGHSSIWRCPADTGPFRWLLSDRQGHAYWQTFPSAYSFAGTSYFFLEHGFFAKQESETFPPSIMTLCYDVGTWHCAYPDPNAGTKMFNNLYGDGHVKFKSIVEGP